MWILWEESTALEILYVLQGIQDKRPGTEKTDRPKKCEHVPEKDIRMPVMRTSPGNNKKRKKQKNKVIS